MSSNILILHVVTNTGGDASESWLSQVMLYNLKVDSWPPKSYAAPIVLFVLKFCAFTGFGGEISSTVSKVLSDCKVLFIAVNGR